MLNPPQGCETDLLQRVTVRWVRDEEREIVEADIYRVVGDSLYILNAYHLPGHNDELYPAISPVNSFRIVFNDYFGGEYDMLEDGSYYSPVPKLYNFSQVPYPCQ